MNPGRIGVLFAGLLGVGCGSSVLLYADEEGTGGRGGATTAATTRSTSASSGGGGGGGAAPNTDCVDAFPLIEGDGEPLDIIFVIDNSGSMSEEIAAVEQNINVNFAQLIEASGIDYRVIMLTAHGTLPTEVCIGPPLSSTTSCSGPPGTVPGRFHHYDTTVLSRQPLCKLLKHANGPLDDQGANGAGWLPWLRTEALKAFVFITDDATACGWEDQYFYDWVLNDDPMADSAAAAALATEWEGYLRALSPAKLGTSEATRKYSVYSITGMPAKTGLEDDPYQPSEPIAGATPYARCETADGNGLGFQWLSKNTGALRFPVCQTQSYDAVFQAIASNVITDLEAACTFALSASGTIDPGSLQVSFASPDTSTSLSPVSSEAACGEADSTYYLDGDTLELCPAACELIRGDDTLSVVIGGDCL